MLLQVFFDYTDTIFEFNGLDIYIRIFTDEPFLYHLEIQYSCSSYTALNRLDIRNIPYKAIFGKCT